MLALAVTAAGCARPGAEAGRQVVVYQCVATDASAPGAAAAQGQKGQRLTVQYDPRGQQALTSLDGGSVNYLPLVPGVKDRLYANSKYAWKTSGNGGQLTDIAEVQTYSCTRSAEPAAARP
ncbi:hypothetical protein [Inquilinus limosus]|uniref:C-type lysozyme inhibitor domain-containing protein n=1 Tax=Inquilinus limosus TaxID=171674 RepID=A0A211ZF02_9PROT|nr:hypothetical protein [Inquilinus limosus]OWJ63825.1 hypothetical protein BWR60_27925 [Inquilinus limosus]